MTINKPGRLHVKNVIYPFFLCDDKQDIIHIREVGDESDFICGENINGQIGANAYLGLLTYVDCPECTKKYLNDRS